MKATFEIENGKKKSETRVDSFYTLLILPRIVDEVTYTLRRGLYDKNWGIEDSLVHGMTEEEIGTRIKMISSAWYEWSLRYTGEIVNDFKAFVDICKDKRYSTGCCNVFDSDMKCFEEFKKEYGIEPSYSIGKGEYHYDDKKDDDWSNLCYEFDSGVRGLLCLMWKFNNEYEKLVAEDEIRARA